MQQTVFSRLERANASLRAIANSRPQRHGVGWPEAMTVPTAKDAAPRAPSRPRAREARVEEIFPGCGDAAARLRSCSAAHPPGTPTASACTRFGALVAWCVARELCGAETARLEACCGGVPGFVRCEKILCAKEDAALDRCMQRHTADG